MTAFQASYPENPGSQSLGLNSGIWGISPSDAVGNVQLRSGDRPARLAHLRRIDVHKGYVLTDIIDYLQQKATKYIDKDGNVSPLFVVTEYKNEHDHNDQINVKLTHDVANAIRRVVRETDIWSSPGQFGRSALVHHCYNVSREFRRLGQDQTPDMREIMYDRLHKDTVRKSRERDAYLLDFARQVDDLVKKQKWDTLERVIEIAEGRLQFWDGLDRRALQTEIDGAKTYLPKNRKRP